MSTFQKSEYSAYQGGQDVALRLTAILWGVVMTLLVAARTALDTGSAAWIVPVCALAFVGIGWCQASLSNGFHEAVHKNFGERHSDALSLALLGYPTFFTLQYRTVHLKHHTKFGDPEEDPDFGTYSGFPRTRMGLVGRLLFMGSGLAAAHQLLTKNLRSGQRVTGRETRRGEERDLVRDLLGLAAVQLAILFVILVVFGVPQGFLAYVGLWILPLGTVAKLAKSTRAFCEHGSPDRPFVLRTITGRPWQTGTLGMYGFHYHAEHHLYPWVPYARLGALHERLRDELVRDAETREGPYEHFDGGYFGLLAKWFRELPWREPEPASPASQAR